MPRLRTEDAVAAPFPLPPLAEQHRIVARVDELMAFCDQIEAARARREATRDRLAAASLALLNQPTPDPQTLHAHAAFALEHLGAITARPDQIKALRQTILNLAVRGKLVPQDPSDEPAAELLERIKEEKGQPIREKRTKRDETLVEFDQNDLPLKSGWVLTRMSMVSRRIHYGFTASANAALKEVRMLRITDIQDNSVDWLNVPGCVINKENVNQYKLEKGDILIARTGGTIGKTFLVRDIPVTAVFASYLIRIQGTKYVFDEYLKCFLESPLYWEQLRAGTRGTGQPNVNGQTLGNLILPLPPLAEQHRIVARVDELMALCDRLEASLVEGEATRRRLLDAVLHGTLGSG